MHFFSELACNPVLNPLDYEDSQGINSLLLFPEPESPEERDCYTGFFPYLTELPAPFNLPAQAMSKMLPSSSKTNVSEILRIQKQCDLVREENRIDTIDNQDEAQCRQWMQSIVCPDSEPRFTEVQCLGLGAYGLVFAVDDRLHQGARVAVKVLRPSKATQRVPRERFEFEGQVFGSLKHPNIIELLETGQSEGVSYHIVEWADCGSLAKLLEEDPKCFSPRQAAWLVSKIADALDEAHSLPILHRDIKPGNILLKAFDPLDSEGLGLWPLLTDFGLSKKLDQTQSNPLTNYGEILGTLSYMSPEQVQGQAMRTPSDLFSLGVILHELVYGAHPFVHGGHFQTLTNIVQYPAHKPACDSVKVPSGLDTIISKCLQKDSRSRYRSAAELSEDLRRFLKGETISIATPTPWESFRELVAGHPKLSIFLGTLIASLLVFVLVLTREWSLQRDLANEKSKISELFRQSMLGSNSQINDAILSGRKVLPSELLKNLQQQLPVLEEAQRLAPEDAKLMRHLEVMSHYISLCYMHEMASGQKSAKPEVLQNAIKARAKSLDYIELLTARNPGKEELVISKINGLYNMSVIYAKDKDPKSPGLEWSAKAIQAAEDYLAEHPENVNAFETLLNAKYLRASLLVRTNQNFQEQMDLFNSVIETARQAYPKYPERIAFLITQFRAMFDLGAVLLKDGRDAEADQMFRNVDSMITGFRNEESIDWRVIGHVIDQYALRCCALMSVSRYRDALGLIEAWEGYILDPKLQNYFDSQNSYPLGMECELLKLKYCRWLAIRGAKPGSAEESDAERAARKALEVCSNNNQFNLQSFINKLDELGIEIETIRDQWGG